MDPSAEPWPTLPPLAWGWPHGGRDLLLKAALDPAPLRARAALNQWFAKHAIEATDGREHRLLALVAERFAVELQQRPEGPRLAGLRRQRWTRSQLLLRLAKPAFERMAQVGQPVIVLAETAEYCAESDKSHRSQPQALDILLPDDSLDAGLAELGKAGWEPWSGESMLCLRHRARSLWAMQLQHGPFGCLRLHRWVLGDQPASRELQQDLLRVSRATTLDGVAVLLPDATHRLAMALLSRPCSNQPLDGLLDAALLLGRPDLDGELLVELLEQCRSVARAQINLSYLHQRLHLPLPSSPPAQWVETGATLRQRLFAIIQTRSEPPWFLAAIGRLLFPNLRRHAACGPYSRPRACLGWAHPIPEQCDPSVQPDERRWLGPLSGRRGPASFELDLRVDVRWFAQELVFELETEHLHLIHLRAWNLWPGAQGVRVRFRGQLMLPEGDRDLWITVRPSRQLRPNASQSAMRRDRARSVQVLRWVVDQPESAPSQAAPSPQAMSRLESEG
jgi:hypothetical protein